MEVLREIINSGRLKTLFAVPKSMENMDVEATLKSITGIIRDEGMSLDDYRTERLGKYAGID